MLSRWVSGIIALIILLGTLYFGGTVGLTYLSTIIVFVAAFEYANLFEKKNFWFWTFLSFVALVYLTHLIEPTLTLAVLCASFVVVTSIGVFLFRDKDPQQAVRNMLWPLWGLIYTAVFPVIIIEKLYHGSWETLIYLLLTVFIGDIGAFFAGLSIGGPKLAPNISPKKTISGGIGGLVASALAGTIFLIYFGKSVPAWMAVIMSLTIGVFAQFGDFFESFLKRYAGKKDSGGLMPGHGGFLDRLDGVYFGSAVLYFFYTACGCMVYFV